MTLKISMIPFIVILGSLLLVALPALADHSAPIEEVSHTTTVHDDDDMHDEEDHIEVTIVSATSNVEQMQKMVALLTQLIALLKEQKELIEHGHDHNEHDE